MVSYLNQLFKARLLILFLLFNFTVLNAQQMYYPAFGTDSTFEAVTWNIEWFPKNGQTTVDLVGEIIMDLQVDMFAMQEIDNKAYFDQLLDNLEGYDGYYVESEYSNLAYVYKSEVVEILEFYEIYTTEQYWRPFPRAPMVVKLKYGNETYTLINNHFKCCGDGYLDADDPWDEETRRRDASILLEDYVQSDLQGEKVIILGDLNDVLTDSPSNNVFNVFIEDEENYLFVDMEIAEGSNYNWSYPSWPSHIDHLLITNELFQDFSNFGSDIQTLRLDDFFDYWYEYDENISDHRPVALKIKPTHGVGKNEYRPTNITLTNSPNPVKESTVISFNESSDNSNLEIFDLMGNRIAKWTLNEKQNSVKWDASAFPSGTYAAKLTIANGEIAIRKMIVTN